MISKILSGAVLAGLLLSVSAPIVAVAADAPKTKADCKKAKDMKWDKTTQDLRCRNKVSDINFALRRRIRTSAASFFAGEQRCDLTECASASFAELARPVLLHNGEDNNDEGREPR